MRPSFNSNNNNGKPRFFPRNQYKPVTQKRAPLNLYNHFVRYHSVPNGFEELVENHVNDKR